MQIEDQVKRLLTQLEDVEQMKDELDEEEYQSTRKVSALDPLHGAASEKASQSMRFSLLSVFLFPCSCSVF